MSEKKGKKNNSSKRNNRGRGKRQRKAAVFDAPVDVPVENNVDVGMGGVPFTLSKPWHVDLELIYRARGIKVRSGEDGLSQICMIEREVAKLSVFMTQQLRTDHQLWTKRSVDRAVVAPSKEAEAAAVKFIGEYGYEAFLNIGGRDVLTPVNDLSMYARSAAFGAKELYLGEYCGVPYLFGKDGSPVDKYDFVDFEKYVAMYLESQQGTYSGNGRISVAFHVIVNFITDNRNMFGYLSRDRLSALSQVISDLIHLSDHSLTDEEFRERVVDKLLERVNSGFPILDLNGDLLSNIYEFGATETDGKFLKLAGDSRKNQNIKVSDIRNSMFGVKTRPVSFSRKKLREAVRSLYSLEDTTDKLVIDKGNYSDMNQKIRSSTAPGAIGVSEIYFNLMDFSPSGGQSGYYGVYELIAHATRTTYYDEENETYFYPDVYLLCDITKFAPYPAGCFAIDYDKISTTSPYYVFLFADGEGFLPSSSDNTDLFAVLDKDFIFGELEEHAEGIVEFLVSASSSTLDSSSIELPFAEKDEDMSVTFPHLVMIEKSQAPVYKNSSISAVNVAHLTPSVAVSRKSSLMEKIDVDIRLFDDLRELITHLNSIGASVNVKRQLKNEFVDYQRKLLAGELDSDLSSEVELSEVFPYPGEGPTASASEDENVS